MAPTCLYTEVSRKNTVNSEHRNQGEADTHESAVTHHVRGFPIQEGRTGTDKVNNIPDDINNCDTTDTLQYAN